MNVPPAILDMTVQSPGRARFRLWLPLFLLWPLLLAVGILSLVATLLTDAVLFAVGRRYYHYTLLLYRCFEAFTETRGMVIRVRDGEDVFDMALW